MAVSAVQSRGRSVAGVLAPLLVKFSRERVFCLPGDVGDHSRVLVVDSGELSELLFFAPVVKLMKRRFPAMRVSFLVREGHSELVRGMSQVNEMISYEPAHLSLSSTTYFSLLKRLRGKEFSVVFLLGREFDLPRALLAFISGATLRIGFSQEYAFPFINCELRRSGNRVYEGERARSYLTALGFPSDDALPKWMLPEQDLKWARRMIHFRKPEKDKMLLAVDPGKGKGRHRLVDESFAFLVNNFVLRYPAKVIVLSHNAEKRTLDRFESHLKVELVDIEPKNVKEALALLSCADLFLAGNTDFFHFAVSLGVPTVGLFTEYDGDNWIPRGKTAVQIIQGVKGQKLSLDEFFSKIETLLHFTQ